MKFPFGVGFELYLGGGFFCLRVTAPTWCVRQDRWFQRLLLFSTPILREMIQFDEHIFQMGWNHQLVMNSWDVIGKNSSFWWKGFEDFFVFFFKPPIWRAYFFSTDGVFNHQVVQVLLEVADSTGLHHLISWHIDPVIALFPKTLLWVYFVGFLHVGPTKSLTFSPGDLRVGMI